MLNGQKVWTSVAQHADIGLALSRTNPDAPKHRGITAFLVPMDTPGVEVRPLRQMTGGADFNEVFLTDVRVPDDHRLGEVDGGWTVALTTLMNERATVGSEGAGPVAAAAVARPASRRCMRATWTLGRPRPARPARRTARRRRLATEHLNARAQRKLRAGAHPGPETSVVQAACTARTSPGPRTSSRTSSAPALIADTGQWGTYAWSELLLATPALRILGGTEEIMKNILAERVLGLPKEPVTTAAGSCVMSADESALDGTRVACRTGLP